MNVGFFGEKYKFWGKNANSGKQAIWEWFYRSDFEIGDPKGIFGYSEHYRPNFAIPKTKKLGFDPKSWVLGRAQMSGKVSFLEMPFGLDSVFMVPDANYF